MNGVKQLVPIPPVQETVTARPGSNRIQSDPTGSSRIQPDPAGSSRIQPDPTGSSPAHPSLHVAPPLLSPLPYLTTTTTTTTATTTHASQVNTLFGANIHNEVEMQARLACTLHVHGRVHTASARHATLGRTCTRHAHGTLIAPPHASPYAPLPVALRPTTRRRGMTRSVSSRPAVSLRTVRRRHSRAWASRCTQPPACRPHAVARIPPVCRPHACTALHPSHPHRHRVAPLYRPAVPPPVPPSASPLRHPCRRLTVPRTAPQVRAHSNSAYLLTYLPT